MAQKNKALPYLIFGVPIAIGLFFVYKYVRNSMGKGLPKLGNATTTNTATTTTTTTTNGSGGTTYTEQTKLPFKKGSQGSYVVKIQSKLGISADGKFGSQTESSVKAFQKTNNLTADGIVGAKTWRALLGADFPKEGNTSSASTNLTSTSTGATNYQITPKFSQDAFN